MAFVKGSLGDIEKVKEYTDGLEGRIDSAFGEVDGEVVKITEKAMLHRGFVENANSAINTGTYHATGSSINVPTSPSFLIVFGDSDTYKAQFCLHWNNGGVYARTMWSGEWKSWRLLNQ